MPDVNVKYLYNLVDSNTLAELTRDIYKAGVRKGLAMSLVSMTAGVLIGKIVQTKLNRAKRVFEPNNQNESF